MRVCHKSMAHPHIFLVLRLNIFPLGVLKKGRENPCEETYLVLVQVEFRLRDLQENCKIYKKITRRWTCEERESRA